MAEDEIPPLEDMTELLNQVQSLQEKTESHWPVGCREISSHTSTAHSLSQPESISSVHVHNSKQTECVSKNTRFGGMKKGFLFGQSKPTPKTQNTDVMKEHNGDKCSPEDSIPFLKPRTERKDSDLNFAEVQEAMESHQGVFRNKDWVTGDLLDKVQKNEMLAKRLSDPIFMQAITDFQKNPEAAISKYQSNTEVWSLLKEFCGILGQHFMELGEKQDLAGGKTLQSVKIEPIVSDLKDEAPFPARSQKMEQLPEDPDVQKILSDPVNIEILSDPSVQKLFQSLRSNPEAAQRMIREGDDLLRAKVDQLISLGLIRFQT